MKFVSWNVNSFKACWEKNLLSFTQKEKADFYIFQETKTSPEKLSDLEKKKNSFEILKKGLMQQLLTGQKQVMA